MKYKYNGQWVDLSIKALDSMEIGCIIQYMGNTIPNGWLECNGASISQSAYPELYNLIGGTLPDFRGRVLVGQDTTQTEFDTLGETGGEKKHTLTTDEIPPLTYTAETGSPKGSLTNGNFLGYATTEDLSYRTYTSLTTNAGGQSHNNLQPYAIVKHIIKAVNTTPTMASIVNGYSTSTQDGYSCEYINGINTYSTNEVDTGKVWIDGKKIYRTIIETNNYTQSQSFNISVSSLNIDTLMSLGGMTFSNSMQIPIPFANQNNECNYAFKNGNNIACYLNYGTSAYIILEYTKTTDNTNTRNLQESKKSVSEDESIEEKK